MIADEKKEQLVQRIVERVEQDLGDSRPRGTDTFIREYFRGISRADLDNAAFDDLCGSVRSLIELALKRRPDWPEIRLINPSRAEQGWQNKHTVIEMVNDDMPFLLDSVIGELGIREISIHLAMHPQMRVERDADGNLLGFYSHADKDSPHRLESFMHIEIDQQFDQGELIGLETELRQVLGTVRAVVDDWVPMRRGLKQILEQLDIAPPPLPDEVVEEARHFLNWVDNHHFTLLGYVEYTLHHEETDFHLRPKSGTGLGMLRKLPLEIRAQADQALQQPIVDFFLGDQLVQISKASLRSKVHRPVPIDRISVKRYDSEGKVVGEIEFLGLFTSMAYSITASEIPLVRRKVQRVIDRAGFLPNSHNAKGMRHLLEHYPRDELFQIHEDDLYRFAIRILELLLRPQLALFVRRDQAGRFASCMIYVPRDQHNTGHRFRMQEILEEGLGGEVQEVYISISDRPLAQLQFIVKLQPGVEAKLSDVRMEELLADAVRLWSDRLKEALIRLMGEQAGIDAWRLYGDAFPASYEEHFSIASAIEDIPIIEQVRHSNRLGLRLYQKIGASVSRFHLRTFELAVPKRLSNILPMLENMGLEVDREIPFEVRPKEAANPIWVRDFELISDEEIDLEHSRDKFQEAFSRIWTGEAENDRFSRLVLRADLAWREVIILRAYARYLRQIKIAFSQSYMANTLARNPKIARLLVDLFNARLDPAIGEHDREQRPVALLEHIHQALEAVRSLDEDRILRRFLNLIEATLRTNYFQRDADGHPKAYLSFKFDCSKVPMLPQPRPRFEIFVYSPRVEAVHLRGGRVARGGIRWSDRREDFRTEILGLVKAQIVKNAVIVPVGAKGGFVVKRPPAPGDREAMQQEGIECYKTLIRGMLDITDNLRGNEVIPPPDVVRRDEDDPYLVVAADKGTATFSDIANQVARDYGFWLDDAFASGGSAGYDHKKMGITARGAWESVKRHFREIDQDIQRQEVTAVGVGDMSGDVFGNGMLLSGYIKLLAAFNHMHIFVDPDPDFATSYAERRRLFETPRSTWADYDPKVMSRGGAVYSRDDKVIQVTPEIRQLFELPDGELSPNDLIGAILKAKVDLMWFGGIGTYVKASHETHLQAGDRHNDEIRIDATELRCKVIGEGANLGLTQAGRIEYALHRGRLNTDFIDNSGGVDCSDHEVNIKIALSEAIAAGEFPTEERESLLEQMTDGVGDLVLRDNYLQSQSISLIEVQSAELLDEHARFIRDLERSGSLDRRLEGLPDTTTIYERRDARRGLTRPEIAVLLAYAKMDIYSELLDSDLPDEIQLVEDLVRYFPEPMRERFRPAIERHRLRREIIATHVANSMANRVGPTFVSRMSAETGSTVSNVARAYAAARDVFDLRDYWSAIEDLDNKISAETQIRMMLESVRFVERATRWFLRNCEKPLRVADGMAEFHDGITELARQVEDLAGAKARAWMKRTTKRLVGDGVPRELAQRVAGLRLLPSACDVVRCAAAASMPVPFVGKIYFALGERFGFNRLRKAANRQGDSGPWHRAAAGATIDDLYSHQAALTNRLLAWSDGREKGIVAGWVRENRDAVDRVDTLLQDLNAEETDIALLVMAERALRRLADD